MATGLTLAFDLEALKRLAAPAVAFQDARRWSESVGVVSDQPPYVLTKFTREHGLRNDFPPEPASAAETLEHMRTHHDTERYVYVAPDGASSQVEGWELLPVSDAAERADWEVDPDSPIDRTDPVTDEYDSDWP